MSAAPYIEKYYKLKRHPPHFSFQELLPSYSQRVPSEHIKVTGDVSLSRYLDNDRHQTWVLSICQTEFPDADLSHAHRTIVLCSRGLYDSYNGYQKGK